MKHWSEISNDPNHPEVRHHLKQNLLERRKARISDTYEFLRGFVRDQRVLDIGVVAHTSDRTHDTHWKHGVICSEARRVVGIDIVEDAITNLQERGFDVRLMDATSEECLDEKFDRVVCGDVIEHVNDPQKLLTFVKRHLREDGLALITTPNPFFVSTLMSSIRQGVFIANAQHTSWITPSLAVELGHRSGLELKAYHHTQGDGKTPLRKIAVNCLEAFDMRDAELFSGSFYYIFGHKS